MDTPNTSPNTTQKALIPAIAPKPVNPNNNQADSPVALKGLNSSPMGLLQQIKEKMKHLILTFQSLKH